MHDSYFNLVRSEVTAECTVTHLSTLGDFMHNQYSEHKCMVCQSQHAGTLQVIMQECRDSTQLSLHARAVSSLYKHAGTLLTTHARAVLNSCMLSVYYMQGLYWTHDMQRQHLALVTCTNSTQLNHASMQGYHSPSHVRVNPCMHAGPALITGRNKYTQHHSIRIDQHMTCICRATLNSHHMQ